MRAIPTEYYGDETRWFVAVVVNSTPPPGLEGRVRVRIYGVHTPYTGDILESDLPWAQVLIPSTEGGVSGFGRIPQVTAGSFVFGIFMDGKPSQLPLVLGSMPHIEVPTSSQIKLKQEDYSFDYYQERQVNFLVQPLANDGNQLGEITERRSQCIKFFIDNGYTLVQAAGITGNLQSSSGFELYKSIESTDQGIASWSTIKETRSRFDNLVEFSGKYDPSKTWRSFSCQLQFVLHELRSDFSLANSKLKRAHTLDGENGSVQIFSKYYLKRTVLKNALSLGQLSYDEATQ